MKREEVKSLIKEYFGDGFEYVDIEQANDTIGITSNAILRFCKDELIIVEEYGDIEIPYETIEHITI